MSRAPTTAPAALADEIEEQILHFRAVGERRFISVLLADAQWAAISAALRLTADAPTGPGDQQCKCVDQFGPTPGCGACGGDGVVPRSPTGPGVEEIAGELICHRNGFWSLYRTGEIKEPTAQSYVVLWLSRQQFDALNSVPLLSTRPAPASVEPSGVPLDAKGQAYMREALRRSSTPSEPDGIVERLRQERDQAQQEAVGLATTLHRLHFADVMTWKPLDYPAGVISQIDNMVAGIMQKLEARDATITRLEGEVAEAEQAAAVEANERRRAEARVAELLRERDEAREALKPFAEAWDGCEAIGDQGGGWVRDEDRAWVSANVSGGPYPLFLFGDLRRARSLLTPGATS